MKRTALALVFATLAAAAGSAAAVDMMDVIEHKYVDSDGGKIHYAAAGSGPLVVFVHGFPDFWYSWNHQMAGLMDSHRVVASIRAGTTGAANRRTKKTTT